MVRVAALAGFLLFSASGAAAISYQVIYLGALPDGDGAIPYDINNSRAVVGVTDTEGHPTGFVWQDGTMTDLGSLWPGGNSAAYSINDAGHVVGETDASVDNARKPQTFIWESGEMISLGDHAANSIGSGGRGINETGTVVGWTNWDVFSGRPAAASWRSPSQPGLLGAFPLSVSTYGIALDVNSSDQAVGWSTKNLFPFPPKSRAVLWEGSEMIDLGSLVTGGESAAYAINDTGDVVGFSENPDGRASPVVWHAGGLSALSVLDETFAGFAHDINNAGTVIGWAQTTSGDRATVWTSGQILDLNALIDPGSGWLLNQALAINENGDIVGVGTLDDLGGQAFLLVAVPEPSPAALLLLSGTVWACRRREAPCVAL